jgi:hypothetical protein
MRNRDLRKRQILRVDAWNPIGIRVAEFGIVAFESSDTCLSVWHVRAPRPRSEYWPPDVHLILHVCCTEPFYDVWQR